MGGPKRLLHFRKEDAKAAGTPQTRRKLFFSSLLTIPLLTACASTAHALPRRPEVPDPHFGTKASCDADYRSALKRGERVREIACTKARTYVLTNKSMLVFHNNEQETVGDGVRLKLSYSRTDMSDIHKRGLVAWAQSDDRAYFLTRDGSLSIIPADEMGPTIKAYQLPFDVSKARMIHRSGILLIAPLSENLLVMSFSKSVKFRILPISGTEGEFFERGGKLFFGKRDSDFLEIRMAGDGVDGVSAIPR